MAQVFINGRFYTQPFSGVQRYASEIVKAIDGLVGAVGGADITVLCPEGTPPAGLRSITQRIVGQRHGHLWDQLSFANAARGGIAVSLTGTTPMLARKSLVVIHDASVYRHPEHYSRQYGFVHKLLGWRAAARSSLATVSQFSARELADVLKLPRERILVAPNGADHLKHASDHGIIDRLKLHDTAYFLTLGNFTANKNVAVAIRALNRLDDPAVKLVAVGNTRVDVFGSDGLPLPSDNVVLPGRLDDAEVAGLMASARALIFPSIYEGFGIPPLEAMSNSCPVLASTAEAVMEVCGDAADYFSPHDDAELARLMAQLLGEDDAVRQGRIRRGHLRVEHYQWRDSARVLLDACARL